MTRTPSGASSSRRLSERTWTADFDAPEDKADELAKGMGENVFQGGFDALKSHFSGQK